MGYTLQAIIGQNASLPEASAGLTVIKLGEDLWMGAPLSSGIRDRYGVPQLRFGEDDRADLPAALSSLCRGLSRRGLLAYVEAAFWGGIGMQASAIFKDGAELGRPVIADRAINHVLKLLGVAARADCDEFETVGLGRYRNTTIGLRNDKQLHDHADHS